MEIANSVHGSRSLLQAAYANTPPTATRSNSRIARRSLLGNVIEEAPQQVVGEGSADRVFLSAAHDDHGGRLIHPLHRPFLHVLLHFTENAGILRQRLHLLLLRGSEHAGYCLKDPAVVGP